MYITESIKTLIKDKAKHIRTHPNQWSLLPVNDYKPRNQNNKYLTNLSDVEQMERANTKQMSQAQLNRTLRIAQEDNIRKVSVTNLNKNSLTLGMIQNATVADSKLRENLKNLGVEVLSVDTVFNGYMFNYYYSIKDDILPKTEQGMPRALTNGEFMIVIKKTVSEAYSVWVTSYENINPFFTVWVDYIGYDENGNVISNDHVRVFAGDLDNLIQDSNLVPIDRRSAFLKVGSDVADAFGTLMTSHFHVQHLRVDQTGGNSEKFAECLSDYHRLITTKTKSHNKQVYQMKWGTLWDFESRNNGCFFSNLNAVLKIDKSPHAEKRYATLWSKYSPTTFANKDPLSINDAKRIAKEVGYDLTIHDIAGEIIYSCPSSANKKLHFVLVFDHYLLIKEFTLSEDPTEIRTNLTSKQEFRETYNVYYDIETVATYKNMNQGLLKPYANAWKIGNKETRFCVCDGEPSLQVFDKMMIDMLNLGPKHRFRMIAYNGSNFDHIFFFRYLVSKGYKVKSPPTQSGRLLKATVILSFPNGYSLLDFWDPYTFTVCPLVKACESFQLEITKHKFNHEIVQRNYESGNFKEFLTENLPSIEEYNKRDVDVLCLLSNKVLQAISLMCDIQPRKLYAYPTLPNLCFKWWSGEYEKKVQKSILPRIDFYKNVYQRLGLTVPWDNKVYKSLLEDSRITKLWEDYSSQLDKIRVNKVKELRHDIKIRSSICGGRVEGDIGITDKEMVLVDIVSLYPTVMRNNVFPVGDETIIQNPVQAKKLYEAGKLGVYYIQYDQTKLTTEHTILPLRDKNSRLKWIKCVNTGWVPSPTIASLIEYGADVDFIPDEDGDYAIVWDTSANIFDFFVDHFASFKNEQDKLREEGKPANDSVRTMAKLILNGLSGKMVQRNFPKKIKFIQSNKSLMEELNGLANWTEAEISNITPNVGFLTKNKSETEVYRAAKPSQIGVFIYAYARKYMFDNIFSRMHVHYSDTDSALITTEDYEKIPIEIRCDNRQKQFGDAEIEVLDKETKETKTSKVFVYCPKVYCLFNKNGDVIKSRVKGVRSTDRFSSATSEVEDVSKLPILKDNTKGFFNLLEKEGKAKVYSSQIHKIIREAKVYDRYTVKLIS